MTKTKMTTKEFQELVLDEQRKWGASPGTVLIEEREFVKLPKSEGKSEPVKKVDPVQKITDDMYARLTYGYVKLPADIHRTLSEGKAAKVIPAGMHVKLVEALTGHGGPTIPDGMHARLARVFSN